VSGQLPLPLRLAPHARFATFTAGGNGALLAHLTSRDAALARDALWIWGVAGAGKSHLLQAACAERPAGEAIYLPLGELAGRDPGLLDGIEGLPLVALDDIDCVAQQPDWNRALFNLFNGVAAEGGRLIVSAAVPPNAAGFSLPDLASRASATAVYQLAALADEEIIAALQKHAVARGLELSAGAAQYLFARVPRQMALLCGWLDRLDQISLSEKRRLTIPLIREALAEQH
jgi:DnaA family protein